MSSLFSKTTTLRKDFLISDSEFLQLRDFIYQKSGIFVAENRKYLLENRLCNRLKELNLNSFTEYYYYLKYDPSRKQELNRLFAVITTNETSFFRNMPQLEVFEKNVLTEMIKKNAQRKYLRIWSAGCSTGEEPYTLAMIMHEVLGSSIRFWDIKIIANDLSEEVLMSAKRGIYTDYTLRSTPRKYLEQYFEQEGRRTYKKKKKIKDLISFETINLSDRFQLKKVIQSHIIFCRNVIIYFNEEMKKRVINCFYDNLISGGYLFIGHSESLHYVSRAFKPKHYPGAIVYKKED